MHLLNAVNSHNTECYSNSNLTYFNIVCGAIMKIPLYHLLVIKLHYCVISFKLNQWLFTFRQFHLFSNCEFSALCHSILCFFTIYFLLSCVFRQHQFRIRKPCDRVNPFKISSVTSSYWGQNLGLKCDLVRL